MTANRSPDLADLAAMLRHGASGHVPTEAAVELLVGHGIWPSRLHTDGHIATWPADGDRPAMAAIDWHTVTERLDDPDDPGLLVASSSERAILAVATSLAGRHDVRLGELLPCLDATNAALVTRAVGHACNSGIRVTVNRPPPPPSLADLLPTPPRPAAPEATPHGRMRP